MPPRLSARPPHGGWLSALAFRRKLALIVGIPTVVALVGSLLALARVAATYERSKVLERANASGTLLIRAAAEQARERGFTIATLSDPKAQSARQRLGGLRVAGDRLLDEALHEAQTSLRGNPVLAAALRKLLETQRVRDRARQVVDGEIASGKPTDDAAIQAWFDAQTRLIMAERMFGGTLFLAQNPYELVIQYNGFIKSRVFTASEYAGRERARISRVIASGQPIPPARMEELNRWRGVVEENLDGVAGLRANPSISPAVLQSIDDMERFFLGDFETIRQSVYTASAEGKHYALTADEWIAVSTKAIDSILAVSQCVGDEAERISRQQAAASLASVLLIAGMAILLLLGVIASVLIARNLTLRLRELTAGARRVAAGDYSQPISGASGPAGAGDEFAQLAAVFDTMQREVKAGVEQLVAEKAGVELKVRERTHELSRANERLVALNADKDTFLGICSHDLKNPLSGIIGLADLIRADAQDAEQVREYAADVLHSAEFMFQLVANLLDLGAIEQGRFNLQPAPLDFSSLVTRIAEDYRRRAAEKKIRLDLSVPEARESVYADARAVKQVVDNLISNAVKFTPVGGTVCVEIEPLPDAAGAGRAARMTVRDTGPGLSEADQTRLFQKYARLSPRVTGGESSTGLGLSIVQKLVQAMSGTVTCVSQLGHGTAFVLELPRESPQVAGGVPEKSP